MGARIWNFVHIENSVVQILGIFLMDKNPRAIDSNLPIFSHQPIPQSQIQDRSIYNGNNNVNLEVISTDNAIALVITTCRKGQ